MFRCGGTVPLSLEAHSRPEATSLPSPCNLLLPRQQTSPGYVRHGLPKTAKQNTKAPPWCTGPVLPSPVMLSLPLGRHLPPGRLVHLYLSQGQQVGNTKHQKSTASGLTENTRIFRHLRWGRAGNYLVKVSHL